jgi:hypothetical protein
LTVVGDADEQRAERVRVLFLETARDRPIDPVGKVANRPIPPHRNRVGAGEKFARFVEQKELETRPFGGKPGRVRAKRVPVVVVLGKRLLDQLPRRSHEIGTLANCDEAHRRPRPLS